MPLPLRLGFPVKIMGNPELKSNDARRHAQNPHLEVSLGYVDGILDYLDRHDIRMYRLSSDLAPYATHPDLPRFHTMIAESDAALRAIGDKARRLDVRLSFHPSQYIVINSPDPELVKKSAWDLSAQAEMLDRMGLGDEAVLVIHVGGAYGDKDAALGRWAEAFRTLPEPVRRRLVLEHDDVRFSAADVLRVHEQTGVRLIFDHQHFLCLNPEGLALRPTLERILATWEGRGRPKVHFSSPRTELRTLKRKGKDGKTREVPVAPIWTGHADFCQPFEFIGFMRATGGLAFDVMLEAKAKDLALIRLRLDLIRYAPDVALRFGLTRAVEATLVTEEAALMDVGEMP